MAPFDSGFLLLPFPSTVTAGWQHANKKSGKTPQINLYPRLQQFIQLYWYLYITGTLYSGEIIGRIIHVTLCDAAQGHKYWCGRPEGEREGTHTRSLTHSSLSLPSPVCQHTYLYSPELTWQPREERLPFRRGNQGRPLLILVAASSLTGNIVKIETKRYCTATAKKRTWPWRFYIRIKC